MSSASRSLKRWSSSSALVSVPLMDRRPGPVFYALSASSSRLFAARPALFTSVAEEGRCV